MRNDLIPLSRVASYLRERFDGFVPSNPSLWNYAGRGELPGVFEVNGRWWVAPAQLPELAAFLGMTEKAPVTIDRVWTRDAAGEWRAHEVVKVTLKRVFLREGGSLDRDRLEQDGLCWFGHVVCYSDIGRARIIENAEVTA